MVKDKTGNYHENMMDYFGIPKVEEPKHSEIRIAKRQRNKISEMGVYIAIYLLVYVYVLCISGGIQYLTECQNNLSLCGYSMSSMNTIIITTSYVLTPIVAIIGFLSWKRQHNKQTISQLSKEVHKLLSTQNLLAYNYSSYIKFSYDGDDVNSYDKIALSDKTNQTFDMIRLICKITNNLKLEQSWYGWSGHRCW